LLQSNSEEIERISFVQHPGDLYFVRFLDGSVDYCLPAEVAQVCEYVEKNGGTRYILRFPMIL
jgi:hypothetical protein